MSKWRIGILGVLISASTVAQPVLQPVYSGPVSLADLRVLLGSDVWFQAFELTIDQDFCLQLGYSHEIGGEQVDSGAGYTCNRAGHHRLIVKMESAASGQALTFAVHGIETGPGGSFGLAPIEIDAVRGWDMRPGEEPIEFGKEVRILTWRFLDDSLEEQYGVDRHTLHFTARLLDNPEGRIGSGG